MARTKPFSTDLRWALVHMRHIRGLSVKEIVSITGLCTRTVQRALEVFKNTGGVMPSHKHKSRARKMDAHDIEYIEACLEQAPDAYLDELKQHLEDICGREVSTSTIWRALRRQGFTMKKITKVALERNEDKRMEYIYHMGSQYTPDQLVFVDESSFDRRTSYRGYAWAMKGSRAIRKAFFIRGRRYSILPALSLDGILTCTVIEGSFNTTRFKDFIEGLLDQMQPYPAPNSVIVMDNCRIHKAPEIIEMVESRGMRVEFLPAYSPDYNPIEQAFSAIKAFVRRHYEHFARSNATGTDTDDDAEVYVMLYNSVYSVTEEDAKGFFHHSGYL